MLQRSIPDDSGDRRQETEQMVVDNIKLFLIVLVISG